jgi:glycerol-3-phosphate dehydrogenase
VASRGTAPPRQKIFAANSTFFSQADCAGSGDLQLARLAGPLENERYDLIVVGGGVQGVAVALEAAVRGLRPLLLERSDYGAATSSVTLRILHGGLRYLQRLDLPRFRESVRERRWWMQTFPELVEPLPCLMPLYGSGLHRRSVLGPALMLNDLLSSDRNAGVEAEGRLPAGRLVSRDDVLEGFPLTRKRGLRGGALWYDASMVSPQRLIVEMLRWVAGLGGESLNYVAATELLTARGVVTGVRAKHVLNGAELEFRAPRVIEAVGSWMPALASGSAGSGAVFRPSLAFNLLLDRELPSSCAVAVKPPRRGSPVYFLRPYGRVTFAGTVHAPWTGALEHPPSVPDELIAAFLKDLTDAVPELSVTPEQVLRVFPGLLPVDSPGSTEVAGRALIVDHGLGGGPRGLVSVSGVKFTTARSTAERALDVAFPATTSGWASARLAQTARPEVRPWLPLAGVTELAARSPDAARRHLQAVIDEEAVCFPEDLVLRRLDWTLEREASRSADLLEGLLGGDPLGRVGDPPETGS